MTFSFSSSSSDDLLQARLAEWAVRHPDGHIHVLAETRAPGQPAADWLVQIDDYDIRLALEDAPAPALALNRLPAIVQVLEENPGTVALVLVWPADDWPAVAITTARARYCAGHPARLDELVRRARPLGETLDSILAIQTKEWKIEAGARPHSTAEAEDLRALFQQAIGEAIEAERNRSYRDAGRKQAAKEFPLHEEQQVIFGVLREALDGVMAEDLIPMLLHVGKRGPQ